MRTSNTTLAGLGAMIILLSAFVNTTEAQSAYVLLKNATQAAEKAGPYSIQAEVRYYAGVDDAKAEMTDTIRMSRNANSFYYDDAESAEIVNSSEIIQIDKENKIMRISQTDGKQKGKEVLTGTIPDDSSAYTVVSRNAGEIRIRYQSETNPWGIVKADFVINLEDGIIKQADYYYSGSEEGMMYPRISMVVTRYDKTTPAPAVFAGSSYYHLVQKTYIPAVAYRGYKIFFNH